MLVEEKFTFRKFFPRGTIAVTWALIINFLEISISWWKNFILQGMETSIPFNNFKMLQAARQGGGG